MSVASKRVSSSLLLLQILGSKTRSFLPKNNENKYKFIITLPAPGAVYSFFVLEKIFIFYDEETFRKFWHKFIEEIGSSWEIFSDFRQIKEKFIVNLTHGDWRKNFSES